MTLVYGVVTALVFFLVMGRHRRNSNRLMLSGLLIWSFAIGTLIADAATADSRFPTPGHALWALAIVACGLGLGRVDRDRTNRVGHILVIDSVMIGCIWQVVVWRLLLFDPAAPVTLDDWVMVAVLGVIAVGVGMIVLLLANHPNWVMLSFAAGSLALWVGQVMAARDHLAVAAGGEVGQHPLRLAFTVGGTLLLLVGASRVGASLGKEPDPLREERRRGVVVMPLLGIPVAVSAIRDDNPVTDGPSIALVAVILVCFLTREYLRQRHSSRLISRLGDLAMRDPLTNIGNRRALADELPAAIARSRSVCLLSLDIDRFKEINRQLGHAAGDRLLVRLADLLKEPEFGTPFRLGGDEFAVLIESPLPLALSSAEKLRERCQAAFAEMPDVEALAITVSIGVAQVVEDTVTGDPLELLAQSNQALRLAKIDRNRVRVYSDEDAAAQEYRDSIEHCLRQALQEHRIEFFYQPIVSMQDGRVTSVESLARWRDPVLGVVSPQEFVAVAEETGLIHELGWQSLDAGVVAARRLADAGTPISVGINVSPAQLRRQHFADDLCALLTRHGVAPELLTIEVTEGIFISLDDPAVEMLHRLAGLGMGIAIDDFGSGYSSLGYVTRLPATTIKIDRSLTKDAALPRARSIIAAVLGVAKAHDLRVVCEGVETVENARQLGELGADLIQGWLYSPAVAEEHLVAVIESIAGDGQVPLPRNGFGEGRSDGARFRESQL